jgi:hypothetical protein
MGVVLSGVAEVLPGGVDAGADAGAEVWLPAAGGVVVC